GTHVNQPVYNIERRGMHSAVRVVTVSMLTRNICHNRYSVPASKCDVVYNGVELDPKAFGLKTIEKKDKVVLFFGRITMQKGPEYFVHAAKRVLGVMDDVKFVVAGSGDQAQGMIELAASLGIGHKMLFTGFLRGKDIQRVFQIADVYVMPSVSEPFGIAPLEALGHRVPVLISRQSGVSEVLQNALKFDFWDTEDLANKIVAVLRHPPLRRTLREEGFDEVRGITWEGAARKTLGVYRKAINAVARQPVAR
ncbi:MAG: glycosyltransferase family 4 protein, partial [Phycisphaerae bacterium]|nr:glycosyltransferase family 4 protein [Phycisphaerae bacterium]